jgi:ATP-binding protein involved in chromosome partitioning
MTGRPLLDPKTVPDNVRARGIRLVGQYGIAIDWSDSHSTGIYHFRDLRAQCPCASCASLRDQGQTPE